MIEKVLNEPSLKEVDIVVKCKKYPEFYRELSDMEKSYSSDLNMSIYANLEIVDKIKCFDILNRDKLYVNFFGYRMRISEEDFNKIYLSWISKMDELFR